MTPDLSREGLVALLRLEDFSPVYEEADRVRREAVGDAVHIRALLEFSNHCRRKCAYCGLRAPRRDLPRYRMTPEEILSSVRAAWAVGYRTIVLQSGEDPWYTPALLGEIVREIKKTTGMAVTLGCGELSREAYAALRQAGADRYLLKHETADEDLYQSLHPDGTLRERVHCLRTLKALGYETGSGFMVGLPGQTLSVLARDLRCPELDHVIFGWVLHQQETIDTILSRLPLEGVEVRVSPRFAAAVHLDYDEANACGFRKGDRALILSGEGGCLSFRSGFVLSMSLPPFFLP